MIGQNNLREQINYLIHTDGLPRFSIFVGAKGSGRKTFIRELIQSIGGLHEECGIKVDDIRKMITDAYTIHSDIIYFIPDADNMSLAAKNALLKVTEEPPNNAYFIMTLEDADNILETIRSRATFFHMDLYTHEEKVKYIIGKSSVSDADVLKISSICDNLGEINILIDCGVKEFYDYVQLVVDNIAEVSLANAFKIPSKVALKEDAKGYNLKLFWTAFMKICYETGKFHEMIVTSGYLQKLRIKSINRSMLMDNWVLDIRELQEVR